VIELTDEFRERLSTAMMDGYPVLVASVDADGLPHLSFYGTTQVLDHDHLALWARDPHGGLASRILINPRVALVYRNGAERITWFFDGIARREDDPDVRDRVFDASPELERNQDPDGNGIAIVIEVARVRGRGFVWERDPIS
jgi:predicted pyridoxine 5'-phosphate oxidase superfamily flavin-nucleotide-binding protein